MLISSLFFSIVQSQTGQQRIWPPAMAYHRCLKRRACTEAALPMFLYAGYMGLLHSSSAKFSRRFRECTNSDLRKTRVYPVGLVPVTMAEIRVVLLCHFARASLN